MLQNWFIMLPEISLLGFLLTAGIIGRLGYEKNAKTVFALAQFFLAAALVCTVIFYNKSAFPFLWVNTPFTTLFKSFAYLLAWAWFYLSSKWFLNKNRPSLRFYAICFALLLGFDILASSASLLTLAIVIPVICFFYYRLILHHWDIERVRRPALTYVFCATLFCLLLWGGIYIFYTQTGTLEYALIKAAVNGQTPEREMLAAVLMILSVLMFLMAFVPFHNWFVSFISTAVLPVCGFITLVPPLIYVCALVNLMRECLPEFIEFTAPVLCGFAGASLIVGSLSANYESNIRRLFAYISIYCQGVALLGLGGFSANALIASFAYTVIAVLSLSGVYTVFLGIKSRSEYLSDIKDITGFCHSRPYMSAALLIFMFSLIGLAPTLGFFGYLSIINNLVIEAAWQQLALLLGSLLFVAGACLQVIRVIYFSPVLPKYDRADKSIYICLFINVVLILISLINPAWLMRDALIILGGIS